MRKCHSCDGKGFVLDTVTLIKDGTKLGFGLYEKGIKKTCTKCYGKGKK